MQVSTFSTSPLRILWQLMRGHRLRYSGALLLMLFATSIAFSVPLVLRAVIDGAIGTQPNPLPAALQQMLDRLGGWPAVRAHLWWPALLVLGLTFVSGACGYFRGRWTTIATEGIAKHLRTTLYDHLQRLPLAYHHKSDVGDLVQRCTSDVETIRNFLSGQVIEIGRAVLMLCMVLPIMLRMSVPMTCIALGLVPFIITFALLFFGRVKAAFKLSDEAEGRLTNTIQENLTGIRVVRAFARQEFELDKFATRNMDYRDRTQILVNKMAIYWAGSELLCVSQNGLNLLGGAWLLAHGYLSVGTLFGFMALVAMMLWPVRQMGSVLTDMGKALVAIGRVREILVQDHESDLAPAAGPVPETGIPGAVEFRDVTFGYSAEHPVLRNVSFAVAPGETLAIVGPTGSGKTTLINLLLRLHDFEHGSITLNGIDVRRIPRTSVRRQVSVVLQQPFLFSKTLRENIAHGRGDESRVTLEEIEAVATASCVHEAIREFEHGYDTEVGEKGVTLSGGQRQRVALARALLRRPPMLVLDDALSAVDTHTETRILAALEERRGRQTTLIITHRLSSLRLADKILVLDHGRITQFGTHAELIAQPGLYRELWSIQGALEEDLREEMEVANAS